MCSRSEKKQTCDEHQGHLSLKRQNKDSEGDEKQNVVVCFLSFMASKEDPSKIGWVWNGSENPFDKSKPPIWKNYSDVENLIIEEAFETNQAVVLLDYYRIDLKKKLQISISDPNKQRQIQRIQRERNSNHLREDRFTFTPLNPKQPFGGLYGWISPFIKQIIAELHIQRDKLPSKDQKTMSVVINRAAEGIIQEANELGLKCEGEKLAKKLLEVQSAGPQKIWERCAFLYSLQSFLYKKLNEIMRLIGNKEHEQTWRNKVPTLGPFALLLWDNPSTSLPTPPGTTLFRGAFLEDQIIQGFVEDSSKEDKPMHSFPSFTSCSRIKEEAEKFGNVLFVMNIKHAFTVDLKPFSKYPYEEEQLLSPGSCFIVQHVDKIDQKKCHVHVDVIQQHRRLFFLFKFHFHQLNPFFRK